MRGKQSRVVVTKATDVADWGDKECHSGMYSSPFRIAGEPVDIDGLPQLGESGGGGAGVAKAPVRPASS